MANVQDLLTAAAELHEEQTDHAAALLRQVSSSQSRQLQQIKQLLQRTQQIIKLQAKADFPLNFQPFTLFKIDELSLSRIFAFLLDPAQKHYQGTLYLDAFAQLLQSTPFYLPSQRDLQLNLPRLNGAVKVQTEKDLQQYGRADIVLDCPDGLIIIENKAGAADGDHQLERYAKWLEKQKSSAKSKAVLVYLSAGGAPSEYSIGELGCSLVPLICLSYADLLKAWEQANHQATSLIVKNYFSLLFSYLLETRCGVPMSSQEIIDLITADAESITSAKAIYDSLNGAYNKLWRIFVDVMKKLAHERYPDGSVKVSNLKSPGEKWCSISVSAGKADLWLTFEFEFPQFHSFYWGIQKDISKLADLSEADYQRLSCRMDTLFGQSDFSLLNGNAESWCWGKYADDFPGTDGLIKTWDGNVLMQLKSQAACEIHEQIFNKVDRVLKDVQAHPDAWEFAHNK